MTARLAIAATIAMMAAGLDARAEPYRLRADALASAQAPAGLLVLQADGQEGPFVAAEALIWLTGGVAGGGVGDAEGEDGQAQALVMAVRARRAGSEARLGRLVVTAGLGLGGYLLLHPPSAGDTSSRNAGETSQKRSMCGA